MSFKVTRNSKEVDSQTRETIQTQNGFISGEISKVAETCFCFIRKMFQLLADVLCLVAKRILESYTEVNEGEEEAILDYQPPKKPSNDRSVINIEELSEINPTGKNFDRPGPVQNSVAPKEQREEIPSHAHVSEPESDHLDNSPTVVLEVQPQLQTIVETELVGRDTNQYGWTVSNENGSVKVVRDGGFEAFYSQDFQIQFFRETRNSFTFVCSLKGKELKIQKIKDTKVKKSKTVTLKSIWVQRFQFGLKGFLKSTGKTFSFTIVDIKRFDIKEMIAEKIGTEEIEIDKVKYTAGKVHLTLTGAFSQFWNGYLWYDNDCKVLKVDSKPSKLASEKRSISEFSYI